MTVIVDSRRCGEGKTFDGLPTAPKDKGHILSTWAKIKQHFQWDDNCLVVLPSIALCEYYKNEFIQYVVKHSPHKFQSRSTQELIENNWQNQLAVLHSDNSDNVQSKLHQAVVDKCAIIIITQETFKNCDIPSGHRQHYHLICDEAIEPYREQTIYHDKNCQVDFDLKNNCQLLEPPDSAIAWNEIRFFNLAGNAFIDSGDLAKDLTHPNWRNRCLHTDYQKLTGVIPKAERVTVIQELNPSLFLHWSTIWIACAAFEVTFMRYWFDRHKIQWRAHRLLGFEKHKTPLYIYGSGDLIWSSYKQDTQPHIIQEFAKQAKPIVNDSEILVLRNKKMPAVFAKETLLPHNSAGSNDYTDKNFISVESALNPTPVLSKFLQAVHEAEFDGKQGDLVHIARTVYTFYQTIMRSCLRKGQPATVFSLDKRVITGLFDFFDNIILGGEFQFTVKENEKSGRKAIRADGTPMTASERQRRSRQLKREKQAKDATKHS